MGVRGLTAFLDRCSAAWDVITLKPLTKDEIASGKSRVIKLVVDGAALLYHLYFTNNFNCVCGGQYLQFAEHVRTYVSGLQKCGFSLFVIMDGTTNPAKEATLLSRENDLIKTVRQLTTSEKYTGKKVLPHMARQVFVEVLTSLGVKVAYSDGEADVVVASMSRMHACCALSKDSDFFVFDLPAGYIPIDNLEVARNGQVTAKRFNKVKFAQAMGIVPPQVPLLASVIGNDYVGQTLLRPFHVSLGDEEVKMPQGWQDEAGRDPTVRDQIIMRVASFIVKQKNQAEAIKAIGEAADKQFTADAEAGAEEPTPAADEEEEKTEVFTKEALEEALNSSIKQYALDPKYAGLLAEKTELSISAPCGLDAKLVQLYRDGKFDSKIMNVLVNKAFWCHGVVEDVEADSCWLFGRDIRTKIYGIVLEGSGSVTEYIRGAEAKFAPEEVSFSNSGLPSFKALLAGKVGASEAKKELLKSLEQPSEGVDEDMELASACIRAWIKQLGGVTAVELAAIVAAMLQKKEDQTLRASREARPNWLSMAFTQRLAKLQILFSSSILLNQALMTPVKPLDISKLFDGEFIHRFHHLQARAKGINALADQLRKDGVDSQKFYQMFNMLRKGLENDVKGEVVENLDGEGLMWGPSGPEGKEDPKGPKGVKPVEEKDLMSSGRTGGNFGALMGDGEEEEEEDEDEDEEAPASSAPQPAAEVSAEKPKKKAAKDEDDDLAKLMAEMEAVDAKRAEQKEKKKASKKKK